MKVSIVVIALAISLAACLLAFFPVASGLMQVSAAGGTNPPGGNGSSFQTNVANVTLIISPHYTVFSVSASETVEAEISLVSLNLSSPTQLQLQASFRPSSFVILDTLANGSSISLQPFVISGTLGGTGFGYYINLPTNTSDVRISVSGSQPAVDMLWNTVVNIPSVVLLRSTVPIQYNRDILVPKGMIIFEAFNSSSAARAGGQLPMPAISSTGAPPGFTSYTTITRLGTVGTIVVRSQYYLPASLALIGLATLLLIISGLGMFPRGRRALSGFASKTIGGVKSRLSAYTYFLTQRGGGASSTNLSLRRRLLSTEKTQSSDLLVLFVACGLIMIAIAAVLGPNPSVRAYIVADPTSTHNIHLSLANSLGNVQTITPSQDYTDFNVMSSVGNFNLIVISNYPSYQLPHVEQFVVPSLENVPVIVIDKTADQNLTAELRALYPEEVVLVTNAGNLNSNESQEIASLVSQSRVHNALGLTVSSKDFEYVGVIEGGLSFLLIILGWMYFGAKAAEPTSDSTLRRIALVIVSGVFVFYFSEVVYVATSATLQFPLSLHAVQSGADTITAAGVFGRVAHIPLGGGSTPRLLAGLLGVLIGGLWISRGKVFSLRSLGLIVGVLVILLANPFTLGSFVFQGLLLFVGNIPLGTAFASALTFKGFLYGIGAAIGGSASPTYLMSAGKIAFFAGLIPLAFAKKMGKTTATLALLLSAVLVGDGGVRVGEMTPDKTVIGVVPGIIAGLAIAFILLIIAQAEHFISRRSPSSED